MAALTTLATVIARLELTPEEELELAALVIRACDCRGTPALDGAVSDIVEWWEQRPVSWLRRREEQQAATARRIERLVALMRDTNPAQMVPATAAA
jgi:hypothetical protein